MSRVMWRWNGHRVPPFAVRPGLETTLTGEYVHQWRQAMLAVALVHAAAGGGLARAAEPALSSVAGTVTDLESRTPLSGAVLSLVDLGRHVTTDDLGRYRVDDIPPGPQHVVARRIGYAAQTFHALVPREGVLEINIALRPIPIRMEPVEVQAPVAVRGLEPGPGAQFPDRPVSADVVRQHPLLSEPDVLQAASGGEVVVRPESPSGVHVHGGAADQIAYLLDGIPVFSPYHSAGTFSAWNPDALARLDLFTASVPSAYPDALSGAVAARTRAPSPQVQTQGSFSTSQARAVIDGPIKGSGAGYLLSLRSTFPGLITRTKDPSYIQGESTDWLGKLESPLFGGQLRLLGVGSWNEIDAAVRAPVDPEFGAPAAPIPARNALSWDSRSYGGGWSRQLGLASLQLRAWSARSDAGATWATNDTVFEQLTADRRDLGLLVVLELARGGQRSTFGARVQRSTTFYDSRSSAAGSSPLVMDTTTRVGAAFLEHQQAVTARGQVAAAVVGVAAPGGVYINPSAQLRWRLSQAWSASISGTRRRQFAQSLRNPESVVGNIFPADLFVGAGSGGVPIARSDLGIVALEHRPAPGLRWGVQAYARDFESLALVAPLDDDPFATSGFLQGSGVARGVAVEAGANGARYGFLATYGLQYVRLTVGGTRYAPDQSATHSIDTGLIVFPSATSSVRLGISSALGRRGTAIAGPLEWEACNLIDRGCEFAGSGLSRVGPLGGTKLPAYLRVDLGVRKHWHVQLAGRDGQLSVFGAATNLLARKNILTIAIDPQTGQRSEVEMRPMSPLVVGIDWRF